MPRVRRDERHSFEQDRLQSKRIPLPLSIGALQRKQTRLQGKQTRLQGKQTRLKVRQTRLQGKQTCLKVRQTCLPANQIWLIGRQVWFIGRQIWFIGVNGHPTFPPVGQLIIPPLGDGYCRVRRGAVLLRLCLGLSVSSSRGCGRCGKRRRVDVGVFQVLWEGAASSRLSIGRQLP